MNVKEAQAIEIAEAAREKVWKKSFLKEMFLGSFKFDMIDPFPNKEFSPEFKKFYAAFARFLEHDVNPAEIDRTGEYPKEVLAGLRRLGAFGMKIPKKYGGLGLTQVEYDAVMKLLGSYDGNLTALLSAHQSIGAPQPLKLFGTEAQKEKYLPRMAAGAISAFALTEPGVGSDPSSMKATVRRVDGGYVLNGVKLWCTNGTLAEIIIVMARHDDTGKISALVLEMDSPGINIEHRCHFMGLKALANAQIRFTDVFIPTENLVGGEGQGLKIALTTLNTGRLAVPAACVGAAKECLKAIRRWTKDRVQWGQSIGKHEAVSQMMADVASHTFAMEAVSDLGSILASTGEHDVRLEAAAAKEFNTYYGWKIIDDTMQIRGGRGYETETSLEARGELPVPIERMMRDFRINRIFEGSSEIMHLFITREAVDKHVEVAGDFLNPKASMMAKFKALARMTAFYARWYPAQWLKWGNWPKFASYGKFAKHLRFIDRNARKMARSMFYGMVRYGGKLQYKQAFLFRLIDIGLDLYAMSAVIAKARRSDLAASRDLAVLFCETAEQRINDRFNHLWSNNDVHKYDTARSIMDGSQMWAESLEV